METIQACLLEIRTVREELFTHSLSLARTTLTPEEGYHRSNRFPVAEPRGDREGLLNVVAASRRSESLTRSKVNQSKKDYKMLEVFLCSRELSDSAVAVVVCR